MNDTKNLPYTHAESHILEGEKYKVTIKVNPRGMKEMIIQKESNHMMLGIDKHRNPKRTWLRDWSNYK